MGECVRRCVRVRELRASYAMTLVQGTYLDRVGEGVREGVRGCELRASCAMTLVHV